MESVEVGREADEPELSNYDFLEMVMFLWKGESGMIHVIRWELHAFSQGLVDRYAAFAGMLTSTRPAHLFQSTPGAVLKTSHAVEAGESGQETRNEL